MSDRLCRCELMHYPLEEVLAAAEAEAAAGRRLRAALDALAGRSGDAGRVPPAHVAEKRGDSLRDVVIFPDAAREMAILDRYWLEVGGEAHATIRHHPLVAGEYDRRTCWPALVYRLRDLARDQGVVVDLWRK
mgnify:CR=1 FL=1